MTLHNERLTSIDQLGTFCLRPADAAECRAGGYGPWEAVEQSIERSSECFAVWRNGKLFAVWGYRHASIAGSGPVTMWLLTTEEVNKAPLTFVKEGKRLLGLMLERFGEVDCFVWSGHKRAVAWLKWLGFSDQTYRKSLGIPQFFRMVKEKT